MSRLLIGNITNKGLEINRDDFITRIGDVDTFKKRVLNKIVVKEKPNYSAVTTPKQLKPYYIDNNNIIFPKVMQYEKIFTIAIQEFKFNEEIIEQIDKDFDLVLPLYDYQEIAANYTMAEFNNKKPALYIQLDTGLGKTMLAIGVFLRLRVPTLIVAPTDGLAKQWYTDFTNAVSNVKIVIFDNQMLKWKSKEIPDFTNHDVIIVINKTLSMKDTEFLKNCGLAIIDEVHTYTCDTNIKILWLLQCVPHLLGMSATPSSNPSGLDIFPMRFLGNPICVKDMEGVDLKLSTFMVNVRKIEYYGDVSKPYCCNFAGPNGMLSAINTITALSHDPNRNQMIVNEIIHLRSNQHGVMIFSELRHHLDIIKALLIRNGVKDDDISEEIEDDDETREISILRSGIKNDDLAITKKSGSHIVLTTYGYSKYGISLIQMTAMIIATPRRNNIEQIIGRILRKGSDETKIREIVDIVDMNISLKSQFTTRNAIYKFRKYPTMAEKIKFSDVKYDTLIELPVIVEKPAEIEIEDTETKEYEAFINSLI